MKDKMSCVHCGDEFSLQFRNAGSKYCRGVKCGKERRVQSRDRSRERVANNKDPDFIVSRVYYGYKKSAPSRGLEFSLTKDYFMEHFQSDCVYCGDKLKKVGFDRVDNDKGYTVENTLPCCFVCNRMKHATGLIDFLDHIEKISKNQKG